MKIHVFSEGNAIDFIRFIKKSQFKRVLGFVVTLNSAILRF